MAKQVIILVFILASCYGYSSWNRQLLKTNDGKVNIQTVLSSETCFVPPLSCNPSRYRSYDGSCNNLENPAWGAPITPYLRLLPNSYADGLHSFPQTVSGNDLPSARKISTELHYDQHIVDPVWNLNAMQWGQIVTHDMSLTDDNALSLECCNSNQIPSTAAENPNCAPIIIPEDDPLHGPLGHQCLNFVRTRTTWDRKCSDLNTPAETVSIVTAYMDLSLVYGNNEEEAVNLRTGVGGKLASTCRSGKAFPPAHPNIASACPFAQSEAEPCYLTGDSRANQSPQLAILQILLLREHNRIADMLAALNPQWDDEKIYQEARRINIATYQHINYYEYLPILIGREHMIENGLIYPEIEGYVNDYNSAVNPSVSNEHATAAFRHFHSQIRGYLKLAAENRDIKGAIRLSDWLNRPLVLELGNAFNDLARGFTVQEQAYSDQFFDSEVTQFLFRNSNNTFGTDLRSLDIQRGRDHGLGTYVRARTACGLPTPDTFEDMTDFISPENVQILKSLYENPIDVELVVAGSLEKSVSGAQAGPTFLCILTDQFYRTRVGDRYFYENGANAETAFTLSQLRSIKQGASMARLLCDNVEDIQHMQPNAFQIIRASNPLVLCEELPAIDLTLWKEN